MTNNWDLGEMALHSQHLEGITDHLQPQLRNPGVGSPDAYGRIVGERLHELLEDVSDALSTSIVSLRDVMVARRWAVDATIAAYGGTEAENAQAARAMIDAIRGD